MASSGQRSKSFAASTRKVLTKRHIDTTEVKEGLRGEGYKSIKPSYTSRPNVYKAEVQHQHLAAETHDVDDMNDNERALKEFE